MYQFKISHLKIALSLAAFASLFLSGCTKPAEQQTHTVSEYLHDGDLFKKTRTWCMINEGERWMLPNCLNSNQVQGLASSCFSKKEIDHECLEKKGYKR